MRLLGNVNESRKKRNTLHEFIKYHSERKKKGSTGESDHCTSFECAATILWLRMNVKKKRELFQTSHTRTLHLLYNLIDSQIES
jgi:hypothetical protein